MKCFLIDPLTMKIVIYRDSLTLRVNQLTSFFLIRNIGLNPLSVNPTKMVKLTQTICRLLPTNFLSVFDHFVKLGLKGLTVS